MNDESDVFTVDYDELIEIIKKLEAGNICYIIKVPSSYINSRIDIIIFYNQHYVVKYYYLMRYVTNELQDVYAKLNNYLKSNMGDHQVPKYCEAYVVKIEASSQYTWFKNNEINGKVILDDHVMDPRYYTYLPLKFVTPENDWNVAMFDCNNGIVLGYLLGIVKDYPKSMTRIIVPITNSSILSYGILMLGPKVYSANNDIISANKLEIELISESTRNYQTMKKSLLPEAELLIESTKD